MKYFFVFLFTCLGFFVQAQTYTVNQAVEIESEGHWYPGKIVEVKSGKYFISYDGYKDTYNEWVDAVRLRKIEAGTATPQTTGGSMAAFKAMETIWRLCKSKDQQKIYAAGATGTVYVLNAADLSQSAVITHGKSPVFAIAESPDGTLFAVGDTDGSLKIYSTTDYSVKTEITGFVTVASLVFAGNKLVIAAADAKDYTRARLVVWDLEQNKLLHDLHSGSSGDYLVSDLAVDPTGKLVYTAVNNAQKGISCFEVETGKRLWHIKHTADVVGIDVNAAGTKMVSGGIDKKVTCWDLKTRKALWSAVWSTSGYVYEVGFVQDDTKVLVTGVASGYVAKVINTATGKEMKKVTGTNYGINSMVCLTGEAAFYVAQTVNSYITKVPVVEKYSAE